MTRRQTVTSGTPWEPIVGYARAVRLGNAVYVSGTTATDDRGAVVGRGDPYGQTRQALRNIERALPAPAGTMAAVGRPPIFAVNTGQRHDTGRAHGEGYPVTRPDTP